MAREQGRTIGEVLDEAIEVAVVGHDAESREEQ